MSAIPVHTKIPVKWFTEFAAALPASLSGKTYAVTGSTSGTGLCFAMTIAERGGTVVMLNRPSKRAEEALAKVQTVATAPVSLIPCDLQDFASVKAAAAALKALCKDGIDVLCNNAGIMCVPNAPTKDGYNVEIQSNHLSHFLLTAEVWPLLEAAADARGEARVVNHSSGASQMVWLSPFFGFHKGVQASYFGTDLSASKVGSANGFFGKYQRYGQTKYANAVFTHGLATKQSKVKAVVAHPGVAASALFDHHAEGGVLDRLFHSVFEKKKQSTEDGTMGILAAALWPDVKTDTFFGPAKFDMTGPVVVNDIRSYAMSGATIPALAQKPEVGTELLWKISKEATGASFPFEVL